MNQNLRTHLESNSQLPQKAIDEVISMYKDEAGNLLDALNTIKNPEIRTIVLDSLRSYHKALDKNNSIFTQVATIMMDSSNDSNYSTAA